MTRLLPVLAVMALLTMGVETAIGLSIADLATNPEPLTLRWASMHRILGLTTALVVMAVHSIVITYFVGTSRWGKEVTETYRMPAEVGNEMQRLKRRTFPWAVLGMLAVVIVAGCGAAADPATGRPTWQLWVTPHLVFALLAMGFEMLAFIKEWNAVHENYRLIDQIMAQVKQIRVEKGLDPVSA